MSREGKSWIVWLTILAVLLVGVAIFFYYSLFRQSESALIEAIPQDAVFVFDINDNDDFATNASSLSVYLNELFVLDALPAFETMISKLPSGDRNFTISAHTETDGIKLLFNLRADKADFKRLLRAFNIDPKNYISFEGNAIYTYGTNYKSMKFVYNNNIVSISDDLDLLKRSILQQIHPKKILSDKNFNRVYSLSTKNKKQNWLIVNNVSYLNYLKSYLSEYSSKLVDNKSDDSEWSAYQIRFSKNEIFLSGYKNADKSSFITKINGDGFSLDNYLPYSTVSYEHHEIVDPANYSKSKISDSQRKLFNKIAPIELCSFSFAKDSNDLKLLVILPDTTNNDISEILENKSVDSLQIQSSDYIKPLSEEVSKLFLSFTNDTLRWFTKINDIVIFSSNKENIDAYKRCLQKDNILIKNPNYSRVSESVASTSIYEYTFFNPKQKAISTKYFSDRGNNSRFVTNLRSFTMSYGYIDDSKYIPVNIYISFNQ